MKLLQREANPSGAYPPIQEIDVPAPLPGTARWPEELETETFYNYNGFITPDIIVSEDGSVAVVNSYVANTALWQEWKDSLPDPSEIQEPEPEPTTQELLELLTDGLDDEDEASDA